eukprot:CAMPEP_0171057994 /NCGR_PEP_ID=MMETSP0766_2-20121228/2186_1 /TAXON_ID=439317 /ORGANISM="Gambierdiscus australes, Strain CAWD 149" /LENGTH=131 /DNA_ID=CAMNT_0011513205 /DNA_START=30 /DNA_END=425 /DNA_ORIENTATION=-
MSGVMGTTRTPSASALEGGLLLEENVVVEDVAANDCHCCAILHIYDRGLRVERSDRADNRHDRGHHSFLAPHSAIMPGSVNQCQEDQHGAEGTGQVHERPSCQQQMHHTAANEASGHILAQVHGAEAVERQ